MVVVSYNGFIVKEKKMSITKENPVVKIISERDGISIEEAVKIVKHTALEMDEAMMNGDSPEEVLMDELGLEPDYIFEII